MFVNVFFCTILKKGRVCCADSYTTFQPFSNWATSRIHEWLDSANTHARSSKRRLKRPILLLLLNLTFTDLLAPKWSVVAQTLVIVLTDLFLLHFSCFTAIKFHCCRVVACAEVLYLSLSYTIFILKWLRQSLVFPTAVDILSTLNECNKNQ